MAKNPTHSGGTGTMEPPIHERHQHQHPRLDDTTKEEDPVIVAPPSGLTVPGPRAITDASNLIDPDAIPGTRFSGPILSGPMDQGAGIAVLAKRARFTYQNGSFSVPILFPASTILMRSLVQIQQSFNGTTPTIKLELTQGGSVLVGPVDLSVAPTQVQADIAGMLTSAWSAFLTMTLAGATQGKGTIVITYSVPAIAFPS